MEGTLPKGMAGGGAEVTGAGVSNASGLGPAWGELCSFPCFSWQHMSVMGTPRFMVLYLLTFPDLFFFFNKLKLCGNPTSSKSIGAVFSNCICSLHAAVSRLGHSVFLLYL